MKMRTLQWTRTSSTRQPSSRHYRGKSQCWCRKWDNPADNSGCDLRNRLRQGLGSSHTPRHRRGSKFGRTSTTIRPRTRWRAARGRGTRSTPRQGPTRPQQAPRPRTQRQICTHASSSFRFVTLAPVQGRDQAADPKEESKGRRFTYHLGVLITFSNDVLLYPQWWVQLLNYVQS